MAVNEHYSRIAVSQLEIDIDKFLAILQNNLSEIYRYRSCWALAIGIEAPRIEAPRIEVCFAIVISLFSGVWQRVDIENERAHRALFTRAMNKDLVDKRSGMACWIWAQSVGKDCIEWMTENGALQVIWAVHGTFFFNFSCLIFFDMWGRFRLSSLFVSFCVWLSHLLRLLRAIYHMVLWDLLLLFVCLLDLVPMHTFELGVGCIAMA